MQPVILLIYQYDYREVLSASPVIHLLLSHEAVKPNQTKPTPPSPIFSASRNIKKGGFVVNHMCLSNWQQVTQTRTIADPIPRQGTAGRVSFPAAFAKADGTLSKAKGFSFPPRNDASPLHFQLLFFPRGTAGKCQLPTWAAIVRAPVRMGVKNQPDPSPVKLFQLSSLIFIVTNIPDAKNIKELGLLINSLHSFPWILTGPLG